MAFFSQLERRLWYAAGLCLLLIYISAAFARPVANALRDRDLLRLSVAALFVVAGVVLVVGLVRLKPGWRTWSATAVVAAVYLIVLTAIPMVAEERLHFLQYGIVGGLVYLALRERQRQWADSSAESRDWLTRYPSSLVAVLLTGLGGWLDEGIQELLPDRYYDLRDVAFNVLAGLLAVLSIKLIEAARAAE